VALTVVLRKKDFVKNSDGKFEAFVTPVHGKKARGRSQIRNRDWRLPGRLAIEDTFRSGKA
jgi:hypothetical protein